MAKENGNEGAATVTQPTTDQAQANQSVSQDDLNQIRERIRMEERSKLQGKLDKLEASQQDVINLQQKVSQSDAEVTALKSELAKSKQALESLQSSVNTENEVDLAKLVREVNDKAAERFKAETHDRMQALENNVKNMQSENGKLRVENYKQRRITDETTKGTKFILELVVGNTEAEIEQSLQNAIAKHREYFGTSAQAPVVSNGNPAPTVPAAPGVTPVTRPVETANANLQPSSSNVDGEGVQDMVKNLSGKKGKKLFTENRDTLLEAAGHEFKENVGANPIVR